ncbi:redoxin domain-containing protein [Pelagibius sp. Alg239-R121]|uniref:redoxin domain-containing protein n=1 Tax=Pelagibius sp. Alg239-R121 TaxID=2993448 RepID=UPI0024A6AF1C|nr:redoxin domain-containing protein [Pelagibius sp. Alg239-R121]
MNETPAPELHVSQWFNSPEDLRLADLRGRVVMIEAFQMLCPGCVAHGLPQAQAVHQAFPQDKISVIGLHCVFEHHAAMTPVSLEAFLYEYRIAFPVGVDLTGNDALPQTMAAYEMQGTPTLILIDKQGRRRAQYFGQIPDLRLGHDIGLLLSELPGKESFEAPVTKEETRCDEEGCRLE